MITVLVILANNSIPKPTFWTFEFFKDLTGKCVFRSEHGVVCENEGTLRGVLWNLSCETNSDSLTLELNLPVPSGDYCCMQKIVDETTCNPQKVWHDLGEPANLTSSQTQLLQEAANPLILTERKTVSKDNMTVEFTLTHDAVIYFEIFPSELTTDRGFRYGWSSSVTDSND